MHAKMLGAIMLLFVSPPVFAQEATPTPTEEEVVPEVRIVEKPINPGYDLPETEIIDLQVNKNLAGPVKKIDKCYQRRLKKNPHLGGATEIKFTIKKNGRVKDVRLGESTTNDPELNKCIIREIKKAKFPSFGGGIVNVTIPIIFKQKAKLPEEEKAGE